MSPFQSDVADLLARLRRERGASGLAVIEVDGPPPSRLFRRISSGVPVLVLSTLDQYGGDKIRIAAWVAFAARLSARRQPFQALSPCPRRLWHHTVAAAWPMAAWDQQPRLPRRLRPRPPLPPLKDADTATSTLLDLLAPATFIRLEAEMRTACCLPDTAEALDTVLPLLKRIIIRLQHMAEAPGFREDLNSNLSPWFVDMVDRIPPGIRSDPALRRLIGEGLGLAHRFLQTERVTWPDGIDTAAAQKGIDTYSPALPGTMAYRLSLAPWPRLQPHPDKNFLLLPSATPCPSGELPLAVIYASYRPLHVSRQKHAGRNEESTLLLSTFEEPLPASAPQGIYPRTLKSNLQRLSFLAHPRPAWARRMWYDRYGLAAEFRIREVPFVLRWIPPGRFTMGSPQGEPGRYDDEGPRHEVTLSKGYWLAETPVTQAQWRVVVGAGVAQRGLLARLFGQGKQEGLKAAPSHFQGPGELPVENVNWLDSRDFCRLLDALLPDGPGFHLPSEAQWEYACRAGTDTALYNGDITIEGENHAPELNEIAWYGGNSGLELEVENPEDSKTWPNKQFDHHQAGTHRVKRKTGNAWGLYDMLGNVWEWCADEWDANAYEKRVAGVVDPLLDSVDDSADRVIRGGSWSDHAQSCRSACRGRPGPGFRDQFLGFRLAAGQELGGGAAGRGAPSAGEAEPSPEGRRQSRVAGEIFS